MFAPATNDGKPAATAAVDGPSAAPKMSFTMNLPSWTKGSPAMQTPTLPANSKYRLGVRIAASSDSAIGASPCTVAALGCSLGAASAADAAASGGWYTPPAGRR